MSVGCQDRSILWQEIQNGLQFLQSTLPFPGTQDQYEVFIQDLVKNLFEEGNYAFQECNLTKSTEMYTEALSIAEYADSEDISVPTGLLGKLHANRAAAYLKAVPGLYEQALEDCEKALLLNEENYRAWYRKAKSLKEMGRHQDAYEAIAKCSLAVPQDPHVIQLTQDLAKMLGLKIRKAYIRSKPASNVLQGSNNSSTSGDQLSQGSPSVEDIETESPRFTQESSGSGPVTARGPVPDTEVHTLANNTCVVEATPNFNIPSVSSNHVERPEFTPVPATPVPVSVAMPLLPQFVNGVRNRESDPVLELQMDYDPEIIGDDLDDLLDQAAPSDSSLVIPTMNRPISLPNIVLDNTVNMPSIISQFMKQTCTVNLPPPYHKPESSGYPSSHDSFDSTLDSLDSLSISGSQTGYGQHSFIRQLNNDKPMGMAVGMPDRITLSSVDLAQNPLAETHEFKQACSFCFLKNGPGVMDYTLHFKDHMCKKDALVGRIKHLPDQSWKLIRPRPTKNQYVGPYYICKEVAVGEECLYPGHCTFAYCQEEIDVWTMERKGFISRDLLFDPFGANCKVNMTVSNILQEHHGIFMFLCGVCFDHKPRIISKPNKDSPSLCCHPVTKHDFEKHRCLVHILKDNTMRYSKIRPCSPECQLDLCRHEVRYGCVREDDCLFAHSLVELKVWMLQHERGSTHEIIAEEAKKFWSLETSWLSTLPLPTIQRSFGPQNLKMLFVCGQCWRNGQLSEADKTKKYCTAKARHAWSKERRVVLVSSNERKKWTTVRSVPTKKPLPSQFDVCIHITAGKKCQYIGNCSFAHSTEERDLWTYMKDNNILDMEQLYDEWLQSQKPGWSKQTSSIATRENGKQIHMPTDYAEEVAGSHCWLCGKNCNSDKQWQQHITSEKHKEKVFNSEEDQNCWQYRFPTGTFKVCERYLVGTCSIPCKLAHGDDELKEWIERREFLLMKLAKARKDHLIAPNDNDFGKYSFLLKNIT